MDKSNSTIARIADDIKKRYQKRKETDTIRDNAADPPK